MTKRRRVDDAPSNVKNIDDIIETVQNVDGVQRPSKPFESLFPKENTTKVKTDRPTARLKTFHDITFAKTNNPPGADGAPAFVPLSQSDWLPPILAPLPKGLNLVTHTVDANATAAPGGKNAPTLHHVSLPGPSASPPLDWSLKKSLRFASSRPIKIIKDSRMASRADVIAAERSFASCAGDDKLSPAQRLLAASMTWQHPSSPLPLDTLQACQLKQRRQDWQASLCSLYDALRNGRCDAFYVVSPMQSTASSSRRKPYAALFTAAGVVGRRRITAVLSRSTPGVRSLLQQHHAGYQAPLLANESAAAATAKKARPAAQRRRFEQQSTHDGGDCGTRSLLVFEGSSRVHGLFDFLLNRSGALTEDGCDVPLLMAPMQFTGGTVRRIALEDGGSSGIGSARRYHVNVAAPCGCPAWVVDRVLGVLSVAQGAAGLTMHCEPALESVGVGWTPGDAAPKVEKENQHVDAPNGNDDMDDESARLRGCTSAEEASRWRCGEATLSTAAVKELVYREAAGNCNGIMEFAVIKSTRAAFGASKA